jgi:hypothetical protein
MHHALPEMCCALLIGWTDCRMTLLLAVMTIQVMLSQSTDISGTEVNINLLVQAALKKVMSSKPIKPLALLEPHVPSNTIC